MKEKHEKMVKEKERLEALKKQSHNSGLLAIEYGTAEDSRNGSKIRSMSQPFKKPLFLEWEEKFRKEVVEKEEEKRKQILMDIRASKKPMSRIEIDEHAKKYEEELEKRKEQLEEKFEKLNEFSEEYKQKYKTRAYEHVAIYEQQEKERKAEEEARKKDMLDKKQNYGKYVRQSFLPEISREKELER